MAFLILLVSQWALDVHAECLFQTTDMEPPRDAVHASVTMTRRLSGDATDAADAGDATYYRSTSCGASEEHCVDSMKLDLCAGPDEADDPIYSCVTTRKVLLETAYMEGGTEYIDWGLGHHGVNEWGGKTMLCGHQRNVCAAIVEEQSYSAECAGLFGKCRLALRHLHEMMFKQDNAAQVCNNFARKSIRGFFHDQMSNYVDGSILSESHIQHNFGLCRWGQYVNVLSDETGCDPGSIVALAGELGYEACGVPVFEQDFDVKPFVTLNRPYPCGQNIESSDLFDSKTGQRKDEFSDTQLSVNATAMEEFYYAVNGHALDRPDGEIEYSAEAQAAAHAIGRVTCPPDGLDDKDEPVAFTLGFFHQMSAGGAHSAYAPNTVYNEALTAMKEAQCHEDDAGEASPTGGLKPAPAGQSNMNSEGGFCGMPTQFLGTVRVGAQHRVPRWLSIFQNSAKVRPSWSAGQSTCRDEMQMYIPWELRDIASVPLVTNAALERFLGIAWDGVDSIASAWDSCEVGCAIPIADNKLCGGGAGLADFDWTRPYCDEGVLLDAYTCAATDTGDGDAIRQSGVACSASWSVDCVVPKTSDGGVCAADDECANGACKGGRCCNARGAEASCGTCSYSGGNCLACAAGHKFAAARCVDECDCSEGCLDCACGVCSACESGYYLDGDRCVTAHPAGDYCESHGQCKSGACRGGRCCDLDRLAAAESNLADETTVVAAACLDCNSRGLCDRCATPASPTYFPPRSDSRPRSAGAEGHTLCGHTAAGGSGGGFGQCLPTRTDAITPFYCGHDGSGNDEAVSSDGYNYCTDRVLKKAL